MILDNDLVRNGQSLASPFADVFSRKEWIIDPGANTVRNSATVVLNADQEAIFHDHGRDANLTGQSGVAMVTSFDRVRSIYQQIQEYLLKLIGKAHHRRWIRSEIAFDTGNLFPFRPGHHDGRFQNAMYVHG